MFVVKNSMSHSPNLDILTSISIKKIVSAHTGSLIMHEIRAELAKILKPVYKKLFLWIHWSLNKE